MEETPAEVRFAPDPPWKHAKEDLDSAVKELERVSTGTTMQLMLPLTLLTLNLDVCVDLLCEKGLLDRKLFFEAVKGQVEKLTSDVRRAVLSAPAPQGTGPLIRPY